MRINQIRQPICTEDHDYQIAKGNEFRMTHGEGTAIGQVELERPETIGRKFSQLINIHTVKFSANRVYCQPGLGACASLLAQSPRAEHHFAIQIGSKHLRLCNTLDRTG